MLAPERQRRPTGACCVNPGIRSDSDLYTYGFSFKPWQGEKCIADGPAILAYLKDTAREYGVEGRIRYSGRCARIGRVR